MPLKQTLRDARPQSIDLHSDAGSSENTFARESTTTTPKTADHTSSPYFSPKSTRNRRHITIKSEQSTEISSTTKLGKTSNIPRLSLLGKRTGASASPGIKTEAGPVVKTEKGCSTIKTERDVTIKTEHDVALKTEPGVIVKTETDIVIKQEIPESHDSNSLSKIPASPSKHPKWEPARWRQTVKNIELARQTNKAPVDTMGCHMCFDPTVDEKTKRYHILVALMLSSQTKDEVTYAAMMRLKTNGLTPNQVVQMDTHELEKILHPVSFYKNKAKYIKSTAQILIDQYNSDIPKTISDLIKLPGVGPKMGHICMSAAWNIITGIGVDTHVHRITNRLKWTQKPTPDPERTRAALEDWLPQHMWSEINPLLVGFGQTICTPTHPKCDRCPNASICPSKGVKK